MNIFNLKQNICDKYATERGLIRSVLAGIEGNFGRLREFQNIDFTRVDRLVFICLGNICRSPFGEFLAKQENVNTAGFGFATTTDVEAFSLAIETASEFNIDLSSHRATNIDDFVIRDNDLLLVMEVRHARRLKNILPKESRAQIGLLGHWAQPRRLHIHDPHTHNEVYFKQCYQVIKSATTNLVKVYKEAKD
jgi:protein-tyrosine phosphatase